MSKINYHAQTFTLDLDPIEKNIIKSTLSGLYGEDPHYTVWKLANAWSLCFMQDGAASLAINEHGDEPGRRIANHPLYRRKPRAALLLP